MTNIKRIYLLITTFVLLINFIQAQSTEELNAVFTASITSGQAPLTVTFDASASTGKGNLTYDWYVAATDKANGKTATYVFDQPGDYGVELWLTDETGTKRAYQVVRVSGNTPKIVVQAPFTINTDEVEGYFSVVGLSGAPVSLTNTISVFNPENEFITDIFGGINLVNLMDEEYNFIASDLIFPGKDTLEFNARNSVLAEATTGPALAGWPDEYKYEVYYRLEQHPRFQEAVEQVRADKRLNLETNKEQVLLIYEIAKDTARDYATEKGWIDPDTQTILIPDP
jgi:hypothetical protein